MKYVKTWFMINLSAVSGQIHAQVAFPLGERAPRYAVYRSLNGAPSWCGGSGETFIARTFNRTPIPRLSVPTPSHYIDYANPTPFHTPQNILLYKSSPVI